MTGGMKAQGLEFDIIVNFIEQHWFTVAEDLAWAARGDLTSLMTLRRLMTSFFPFTPITIRATSVVFALRRLLFVMVSELLYLDIALHWSALRVRLCMGTLVISPLICCEDLTLMFLLYSLQQSVSFFRWVQGAVLLPSLLGQGFSTVGMQVGSYQAPTALLAWALHRPTLQLGVYAPELLHVN